MKMLLKGMQYWFNFANIRVVGGRGVRGIGVFLHENATQGNAVLVQLREHSSCRGRGVRGIGVFLHENATQGNAVLVQLREHSGYGGGGFEVSGYFYMKLLLKGMQYWFNFANIPVMGEGGSRYRGIFI